jgi:hypothetical protein
MEVARLTGHTRLDTLRRYLGCAENLTAEARQAQQNTAPLNATPPGHQQTALTLQAGDASPHQPWSDAVGERPQWLNLACTKSCDDECRN